VAVGRPSAGACSWRRHVWIEGELSERTFLDYLIPTASEVPMVEVTHLVTPSTSMSSGPKEWRGGTIGATAALANAIADALSLTDVKLPLTPEPAASPDPVRSLTIADYLE